MSVSDKIQLGGIIIGTIIGIATIVSAFLTINKMSKQIEQATKDNRDAILGAQNISDNEVASTAALQKQLIKSDITLKLVEEILDYYCQFSTQLDSFSHNLIEGNDVTFQSIKIEQAFTMLVFKIEALNNLPEDLYKNVENLNNSALRLWENTERSNEDILGFSRKITAVTKSLVLWYKSTIQEITNK